MRVKQNPISLHLHIAGNPVCIIIIEHRCTLPTGGGLFHPPTIPAISERLGTDLYLHVHVEMFHDAK